MSSTDERKIPKIVLKINRNETLTSSQEIEQVSSNSIFSTKAAQVAKEFYKMDRNGAIPFSMLLKRVNQNAYKSIENVLELMGRMNDVEKKKTLFQVLSRLRDVYTKLQLILEWTKVSNEHLALKSIKTSAIIAKDNLNRLIGGFYHKSSSLLAKKHIEPDLDSYKQLLLSNEQVPSYFAPSIEALAPAKLDALALQDRDCWLSTLDSLLRSEIVKNLLSISRRDSRLLSINEGKAKVLFLNLFEFEFTIVPFVEANSLTPAWFVLGVTVESMKELFKNSLTGIFQFKHNNSVTSNSEYFKTILIDCQKYINLFYYEKLFSQFYFMANSLGKSICTFQKSPQGDSFKLSTWFMDESEEVKISISSDSKFIVNKEFESFFTPAISFNEEEAKSIFEKFFHEFYVKKLETFLENLKSNDLVLSYEAKTKFCYELLLFEDFKLKITVNPLNKKYKFDFISSLNFETAVDHLEDSLITFDAEKFTERILEIKREFIVKLVNNEYELSMNTMQTTNNAPYVLNVIECPDVSSKTGICLQLEKSSSCFSIDLNTKFVKFWKFTLNFNNGFLDIKFNDYEVTNEYQKLPNTKAELFSLFEEQGNVLKGLASKNSFETIIKSSGIEGEFETENSFKIYSFGLPNCIRNVTLVGDQNNSVYCNIDYISDSEKDSRETLKIVRDNFNEILKVVKNSIRLFTIWEEFGFLGIETEIVSVNPISIHSKQHAKIFRLSETGGIKIHGDGTFKELEEFMESDSFSIYEFLDFLNDDGATSQGEKEKSPDLTWLSESFM